jgi:hypothetical protein
MPSATINALNTNGQINSYHASSYADARDGTGTLTTYVDPGSGSAAGQFHDSGTGDYACDLAYANIDLLGGGVPSGATVTSATIDVYVPSRDTSGGDYTLQACGYDWGAALTDADFVPGATAAGLTVYAEKSTASIPDTTYDSLTSVSTNLADAIATALAGDGILRLVILSKDFRDDVAPAGPMYLRIGTVAETHPVQLSISWTAAGGGAMTYYSRLLAGSGN